MNKKIKTEIDGQIISIEYLISFLTIYKNIVCTDGKVPAYIGEKKVHSECLGE